MKLLRLTCLVFCLLFPFFVFAKSDLRIVLNPKNPSPYEKITLTAESYSFDVNTSLITWYVQSKQVSSGVGNKVIQINLGGVGENSQVVVIVKTPSGEVVESKITITPKSVSLLWESFESYTPPFYEGKALPGEGARIRVTALPVIFENGALIPPTSLSYSWYMNGSFLESSSGYGRQSAVITLDYLSSVTDIKVRVKSISDAIAEKTVSIYPREVLPIFYSYDEILGINRTSQIKGRLETTRDFILSLSPYYLSTKGLESSLSYLWLLDGSPITPKENTLLAFRPQENSFGTKMLTVMISNAKKRLQKAETGLEILFDTRN